MRGRISVKRNGIDLDISPDQLKEGDIFTGENGKKSIVNGIFLNNFNDLSKGYHISCNELEILMTITRGSENIDIYNFCDCRIGDKFIDKKGKYHIIEQVIPISPGDLLPGCSIKSRVIE